MLRILWNDKLNGFILCLRSCSNTIFYVWIFIPVLRISFFFIIYSFQMLITTPFKLRSMLTLIRNFHARKQPQPLTQPIALYTMEADKSNGDNRTYAFNRQHYSLNNTQFCCCCSNLNLLENDMFVQCLAYNCLNRLYASEQSWAA